MIHLTHWVMAIVAVVAVLSIPAADGGGRSAANYRTVRLKPMAYHLNSTMSDMMFSPDGRTLIALVTDNGGVPDGPTPTAPAVDTVELWNVRTGQLEWTLPGTGGRVAEVTFTPDGNTLALLVADTVELWSVRTRRLITTLDACPAGATSCPDQRHGCLRDECSGDRGYRQAVFSPDGHTLAVSGRWDAADYNAVDIWDYATRRLVSTFATKIGNDPDTSMDLRGLFFGPDSHVLVGIGDELVADVGLRAVAATWDVPTGRVVAHVTFDNSTEAINEFDVSHDRKRLAFANVMDGPGVVEIWQLTTGKKETTLDYRDINTVAFAPDDRVLAMAAADNSVVLADTTGGHASTTLVGPTTLIFSPVDKAAISPDGRTVVGVTFAGVALVWDVRAHRFVAAETSECAAPCGYAGNIAFSHDSRLLALAKQDGTIDLIPLT